MLGKLTVTQHIIYCKHVIGEVLKKHDFLKFKWQANHTSTQKCTLYKQHQQDGTLIIKNCQHR